MIFSANVSSGSDSSSGSSGCGTWQLLLSVLCATHFATAMGDLTAVGLLSGVRASARISRSTPRAE